MNALLSALVLVCCVVTQPRHASCPRGWWMPESVRRDGRFICATTAAERWTLGARGGWVDVSDEPISVEARVYCEDGAFERDGGAVCR